MPTYPGRIPLLGNLSVLTNDPIETWEQIKKVTKFCYDNGNVVVFYVGMIPIYVVTDPDDCNTVLSSCMHKPGVLKSCGKRFLGNGLLVGPVAVWKDHRKLINPTFNQQVLDGFISIFNAQSRRLVDSWKSRVEKGAFDQLHCLEKNTLETICLTTAGVDITEQSDFNDKCLQAFRAVLSVIIKRGKNPLLYFDTLYDLTNLKKIEDSHVKITRALADKVLQQNNENRNSGADIDVYNNNNNTESKFKPFLQRLLDYKSTLSDEDIQDEMNNIIVTGFETSSAVVTFALLLLGTYSHMQEKCLDEIREVFGDSDRDVDKSDLPRLKYLEAVLKETLRLCPVAPITARIITHDLQLKNTVLRKGHICVTSLYGAMVNPHIWGPDFDKFVPERWLNPNLLPKNPNAFAAFGYGRRNCIGKVYAVMTMKVSLVHILRTYRVHGNYDNMFFKNQAINKPGCGYEISLELR
ncbi:unnamed protein product [Leptosia nina]|uniref:Cytochrome P450 n=1 Tax=Leptosia nina TaxID=320188 RepID=A0AAV1IXP6_9NEOP